MTDVSVKMEVGYMNDVIPAEAVGQTCYCEFNVFLLMTETSPAIAINRQHEP